MMTSSTVRTRVISPARTSAKSASYSGVRWWMIGWAMARRTWLGTGVGPGAINWYFFIGASPSRVRRLVTWGPRTGPPCPPRSSRPG